MKNPIPANADPYGSYYSTHLKKFQSLDPAESVTYYEHKLGSTLPKDQNTPILEIGSGLGKFAYYLKTRGYSHVDCVDISEELAKLAKLHADIDVILVHDPLLFLRNHRERVYGAVYMLNVIEHLRKETVLDYLTQVRKIIKPGGWLHLSTENMASPVGGRIQHFLDFTHEYNYSEVTLRQVLDIAGFSKVNIYTVSDPMEWGPRSLIRRFACRLLFWLYAFLYRIERPGGVRPRLFDKDLFASAQAGNEPLDLEAGDQAIKIK